MPNHYQKTEEEWQSVLHRFTGYVNNDADISSLNICIHILKSGPLDTAFWYYEPAKKLHHINFPVAILDNPNLRDGLSPQDIDDYLDLYFWHEVTHALDTILPSSLESKKLLSVGCSYSLLNLLEDCRIESRSNKSGFYWRKYEKILIKPSFWHVFFATMQHGGNLPELRNYFLAYVLWKNKKSNDANPLNEYSNLLNTETLTTQLYEKVRQFETTKELINFIISGGLSHIISPSLSNPIGIQLPSTFKNDFSVKENEGSDPHNSENSDLIPCASIKGKKKSRPSPGNMPGSPSTDTAQSLSISEKSSVETEKNQLTLIPSEAFPDGVIPNAVRTPDGIFPVVFGIPSPTDQIRQKLDKSVVNSCAATLMSMIGQHEVKEYSTSPSKHISCRRDLLDLPPYYRKTNKKERTPSDFIFILDCSGSMYGKPIKSLLEVVAAMSAICEISPFSGYLITSKIATCRQNGYSAHVGILPFPVKEDILERIYADGNSEGLACSLVAAKNLIRKSSRIYIGTDAQINDVPIDKLYFKNMGIVTCGVYVPSKTNNSLDKVRDCMSKYFEHAIIESSPELIAEKILLPIS